jgi:hypothetical protein
VPEQAGHGGDRFGIELVPQSFQAHDDPRRIGIGEQSGRDAGQAGITGRFEDVEANSDASQVWRGHQVDRHSHRLRIAVLEIEAISKQRIRTAGLRQ